MPYSGKQYKKCAVDRKAIFRAGYEPVWDCEKSSKKRSKRSRSSKKKRSSKKIINGRIMYVKGKRKGKVHYGPRGGRYVVRKGKKIYF